MTSTPRGTIGFFVPLARWAAEIIAAVGAFCGLAAGQVHAGGGPENLVLIIHPANAESMYIGNYYKHARNVPDANVLYMDPWSVDFATLTSQKLAALTGTLANRGLADHIDYVLISPSPQFSVPIPGTLISSAGCPQQVTRIAISSAYTLAHLAPQINAGGQTVMRANQFFSTNDTAQAFSHSVKWLGGVPSGSASAEQYYVGCLLGHISGLANSVNEILAMIDRSVAVDGTRPPGTFYFMKTPDAIRSNPRDPHFPAAIAAIQALGGQAVQITGQWLPTGNHDVLGVVTGASDPGIDAADMTIIPGAFCDHLTSFAGTLDSALQEKMTRWIAKGSPPNGASGTAGTVQEPCVFGAGITGKFPHPRLHVWYYQGASLGEALFRSIQWAPFQTLFYGDPLTRPFAYLPTVTVPDAPGGTVSGTIVLTPNASTSHPSGAILTHDLYVDGLRVATVNAGQAFSLDTTTLADGHHDLRVVTYDNTTVASQGRWVGTLTTNNFGRNVTLGVNPPSGHLSTLFQATLNASGGAVSEVRLLHNGRVAAAANGAGAVFDLLGNVFGGGTVRLIAEAIYTDGKRARSAPLALPVTFANPPAGGVPNNAPVAYGHTVEVTEFAPLLLELPGSDREDGFLLHVVIGQPAQAVIEGTGPTVVLKPNLTATGMDTVAFVVNDGQVSSNTAFINIKYSFEADQTPPTPNPMTFATPPTPNPSFPLISIQMTASTATDPTTPIQYKFDELTGNPGGTSSAWQATTFYSDGGLTANTPYTYGVKARDGLLNETVAGVATTVTHIQTPTGVIAGTITSNSIQLIATGTLTNLGQGPSGVFFESLTPGGNGGIAEWVPVNTDTATGLQPNTTYTFRAKARNQNTVSPVETPWSPTVQFTTLIGPSCVLLGDVNGDGNVNGADVGGFARVKAGIPAPGDQAACADYGSGTVGGDISLFAAALIAP